MQKIYVNCKEDNCKETEIYTYSSKEIPKEKFEKYKCLKFETVPSKIISRATQSSKNPWSKTTLHLGKNSSDTNASDLKLHQAT